MKNTYGFTEKEFKVFNGLNTPSKIQDFINNLKINFEEKGDTCMSPRRVLKNKKAHCVEGALFAAVALRLHGYEPLILDMESTKDDFDHVIAVFKYKGYWGAIGKTNHCVLRYREPIYKNVRELVLSFFHEYFMNHNGKKTLRTYSAPINLKRFDKLGWMTSEEDVWYIPDYLTKIKHKKIVQSWQIRNFRKADPIEIRAGKLLDYKPK
ncbi:MAG: hypothetical protein Q7S74_02220 [Nanoarchaeota archaeon]|nr:hypothetical protein [Nanoarchaeota archaeon]